VLDDPDVPVLGNPDGDVALVEWFDYQCPYCKKAHPEIMKLVREDGNIRLVMKDWPIFGPSSLYAARLTLAAGQHHEKALSALMATEARLSQQDVEEALTEAGFSIEALDAAYGRDQVRIDGIIARNVHRPKASGSWGRPPISPARRSSQACQTWARSGKQSIRPDLEGGSHLILEEILAQTAATGSLPACRHGGCVVRGLDQPPSTAPAPPIG
jgi:hypothetical protein